MTQESIENQVEQQKRALEETTERVLKSKAATLKYLIEAGIVDESVEDPIDESPDIKTKECAT